MWGLNVSRSYRDTTCEYFLVLWVGPILSEGKGAAWQHTVPYGGELFRRGRGRLGSWTVLGGVKRNVSLERFTVDLAVGGEEGGRGAIERLEVLTEEVTLIKVFLIIFKRLSAHLSSFLHDPQHLASLPNAAASPPAC